MVVSENCSQNRSMNTNVQIHTIKLELKSESQSELACVKKAIFIHSCYVDGSVSEVSKIIFRRKENITNSLMN